MAITTERNSLADILKYQPMRCDTHFKHNIILASDFFLTQMSNGYLWDLYLTMYAMA